MATRNTKSRARNAAQPKPTQATRGRSTNKWANIQLPEGFKPITAGDYGEPWDPEQKPVLTGQIIGDVREVEAKRGTGRRAEEYTTRVVSVQDEDDGHLYDVWESASLRPWFDKIEAGMRVSVVFQGYRDTGQPSPMKVLIGAIDESEVDDDAGNARTPSAARGRPAAKKAARRGR